MKDAFGRNIDYLRVSVTDRCNLRCMYCMPEQGIYKKDPSAILSLEGLLYLISCFAELGIKKVRLTGGEPLIRKGLPALIREIYSFEGVGEVTLTTNGIYLKKYAKELWRAGIRRINVSLDSLVEERFKSITRGGDLSAVLSGIQEAIELGMKIKLNVVHIAGFNDDEIHQFVALTLRSYVDVRFIELMPIGDTAHFSLGNYSPNENILKRIPGLQTVKNEDPSSPAVYYQLEGAKGRIGFISPMSHQFCAACNRVRLTASGELITCLHADEGIDLRPFSKDKELLKKVIQKSLLKKPSQHQLNNLIFNRRSMEGIGG